MVYSRVYNIQETSKNVYIVYRTLVQIAHCILDMTCMIHFIQETHVYDTLYTGDSLYETFYTVDHMYQSVYSPSFYLCDCPLFTLFPL